MEGSNLRIIKKVLSEYYEKIPIYEVEDLSSREFGFGFQNDRPTTRHKAFQDIDALQKYLVKNVPLTIHYSIAKYDAPWIENMDKKGLISTDIVIDIDEEYSKTIYKTVDKAKKKLKTFLERLGEWFDVKDYKIFFSGSKGFHIYINNKYMLSLEPEERLEVIRTLELNDKVVESLIKKILTKSSKGNFFLTPLEQYIVQVVLSIIVEIGPSEFSKYTRVPRHKISEFVNSLGVEFEKKNFSVIRKIPKDFIIDYTDTIIEKTRINIDERVIVDKHHLIRYPGSLNLKTGLFKTEIPLKNIDDFDPILDSSPLVQDKVKVRITDRKKARFFGIEGVFEIVKLDSRRAFCLICSGAGSYAGGELYL